MIDQAQTRPGLPVPFRLDNSLGPNQAEVLLVMCRFSIDLAGQFTVVVRETAFEVAALDISGQPFEIAFADDFPVRVTDLHIERDPAQPGRIGSLVEAGGAGRFLVDILVPVVIRMTLHLQGIAQGVAFRTPFTLQGLIDHSHINLSGRFAFQLEGYGSEQMPMKFGTCDLLISASSVLSYSLSAAAASNQMRAALLGREAALSLAGGFSLGLDGLEIQMLALSLEASAIELPGILRTETLQLQLDRSRPLLPVRFSSDAAGQYHVAARLPARLSTRLAFEGFSPQPFAASLDLNLDGLARLESALRLHLREQVQVAIGDGTLTLEMEADLEARPAEATMAESAQANQRRRLYARLRAWPQQVDLALLSSALEEDDRTARLLAVDALARATAPGDVALLEQALRDAAPEVRAAAALALEKRGGSLSAPALRLTYFQDDDDRVRLAALLALAAKEGPEWIDAVQTAMGDPNEVLRCQAAMVYGRRGGVSAAGPLLGALSDPNPFVRLCAGTALLNLGREEAIPTIIRLAREDEDICVQMISSITLGQTQNEDARRALQRLLETSQDIFVRSAAFYGMARQERGRSAAAG